MSKLLYYRTGLTGGAATDLDGKDGDTLNDGDFAFVMDGTTIYHYLLDADSAAAESSPDVISPDTNAGDKRWILQTVYNTIAGISPPSGVEITGNISGCIMTNDTDTDHDISFSVTACMDSTNVYHMASSAAIVKRIDAAWAAGTTNGGLLNGSVGASTLYHCYALRKDADATCDFGFLADGDAIGTYKPAGYTYYRWVGFVVTDGSANIRQFFHHASGKVSFKTPFEVISNITDTSYALKDLSAAVPAGRTGNVDMMFLADATPDSVDLSIDGTNRSFRGLSQTSNVIQYSTILSTELTTAGKIYVNLTAGESCDLYMVSVNLIR